MIEFTDQLLLDLVKAEYFFLGALSVLIIMLYFMWLVVWSNKDDRKKEDRLLKRIREEVYRK